MVHMTSPTESDLVKLGYDVVISGELAELRTNVRLTRNAQARLMGVDGENLRRWESLDRGMNIETALRVGEWFWAAKTALNSAHNIDFDDVIPASKAAQYLGVSANEVGDYAKSHDMPYEDLGVLGVFISLKALGRA